MKKILIAIEGSQADAAADALVNLPGVTGSWESSEEVKRDGALEVIATIVTIASGAMSMAEQLRKWYEEYHGAEGNKVETVVIVIAERRLVLDEKTPEEKIAEFLEEGEEEL
jgi:ApbE superfamily uncharacterized protein (UPF0280 family)